jgi:hypothetical protein
VTRNPTREVADSRVDELARGGGGDRLRGAVAAYRAVRAREAHHKTEARFLSRAEMEAFATVEEVAHG